MCGGVAVPGTDNFELACVEVEGVLYYSAEQAYQGLLHPYPHSYPCLEN